LRGAAVDEQLGAGDETAVVGTPDEIAKAAVFLASDAPPSAP